MRRGYFWVAGGAIAASGAVVARKAAEAYPQYQIYLWVAGSVLIFVGLAVLSIGTRSRLGDDDGDAPPDDGGPGRARPG